MYLPVFLSLVSLLRSLVEVHSQTEYPYVSFKGNNLTNHSYVDFTQVGSDTTDPGDVLRCYTDLTSCCSSAEGNDRGDWHFPNKTRLPFRSGGDIYKFRTSQQVYLGRKNNALPPSGIYYCRIAVQDDSRLSKVYLGLYPPSGGN